mmetsp:Transcript_8635/g.35982  ORF Transcript_8635/g.35982 Transcript_8635/m.35982 type:complete len:486 (+) Transcript_8635:80-1537(+)
MGDNGITINFDDDDEVLEVPEPEDDLAGEIGALDKLKLQLGALSAQAQMNRRRTAGIVAAGLIIVILCLIVIVFGVYLLLGGSVGGDDDLDFSYDDPTTAIFYTRPITIMPSMHWEGQITKLNRPSADVALRQVKFDLVGKDDDDEVPLEVVYNHHILLYNEHGEVLAAIGAEGDRSAALKLPEPYGVVSPKNENWEMSVHLVNVWGLASGANMTVRIRYEVTYTATSKDIVPVNWFLAGPTDNDNIIFDIDRTDKGDVEEVVYDFDWEGGDGTLVLTMGHLHIGGVNTTLYDVDNDQVIAFSAPVYSDTGYIVALGRDYPMYEVKQGTHLRITCYYSTDHTWQDVMSLFQIFGSFPNAFEIDDSSEAEHSFYFEYQAFTSMLSFSWGDFFTYSGPPEPEYSPVAQSPAHSPNASPAQSPAESPMSPLSPSSLAESPSSAASSLVSMSVAESMPISESEDPSPVEYSTVDDPSYDYSTNGTAGHV